MNHKLLNIRKNTDEESAILRGNSNVQKELYV